MKRRASDGISDDPVKSGFEVSLESASMDGLRLFDEDHAVSLGSGLYLDLRGALRQSSQARTAFKKLTAQERFVLVGHLILRKTQGILATLIGLNECRLTTFLALSLERFAALIAVSYLTPEDLSARFHESGIGYLTVKRRAKDALVDRPASSRKEVRVETFTVLLLLEGGKSWWEIGLLTGVYYSSLRQEFERAIEQLKARPDFLSHVLSVLMESRVAFTGVKDVILVGGMAKVAGSTVKHQDSEVLGQGAINMAHMSLDDLFTPRALNASNPD